MAKTEIQILGQKYTIKGDAPEEYMKELAAFVDAKIKDVLKKAPGMNPLNASILAALNIAEELHTLKKEQEIVAKNISEKTSILTSLFEEG
jgi:cell division protein ZapA